MARFVSYAISFFITHAEPLAKNQTLIPMRNRLIAIAILLAFILVAVWVWQMMTPQTATQPFTAGPPYLNHEQFRFERTWPAPQPSYYSDQEWSEKSEEERQIYWKCDYPLFTGSKSATAINQTILEYILRIGSMPDYPTQPHTVEDAAEALHAKYQKEMRETGSKIPFQFSASGTVLLNQPGLLTVRIEGQQYYGGAHGMDPVQFFVFNSETGALLTPADIFKPDFDAQLNSLIDKAFRRQNGLAPNQPLDEGNGDYPGLMVKELSYTDNFAADAEGMTFMYNEYELACYAYGKTDILIPWNVLLPILKDEFITKHFNNGQLSN